MKLAVPYTVLAFGALQAAAAPAPDPVALAPRATPTVYLCGDSTMAKGGAGDGDTDGWGQYLYQYTSLTVVNKAIAGRSARSYTTEGRFTAVADLVTSGDIVVIEFGHNDGSTPTTDDNGRSDCPGTGTETCISDVTGETVYTFVFYLIQAAELLVSKGATVILSTQTPNNPWETGVFVYSAPRFVGYVKTADTAVASSSVTYVDHFQAVDNMYEDLGDAAVNALYPNDHTHTSPTGANLVAEAFAEAVAKSFNGTTSLTSYITTVPSVYRL